MEKNLIVNHSLNHPAYLMCREPERNIQHATEILQWHWSTNRNCHLTGDSELQA